VKRYRYFFFGIDEPISIEAKSKHNARRKLEEIVNDEKYKHRGYEMLALRKETSETLVVGVSTRQSKHGLLIWSKKGWIKNETYKRANQGE